MAFSRVVLDYAGSNTFAVNFTLGYLSREHVTARVNAEVDGLGAPVYRTLTWLTEGTVQVSGSLSAGDIVTFERTTPKNELTNVYLDGDVLDDENIDDSFKQAIMIAHEVLDGRLGVLGDNIDMGTNRIVNMADPLDAQDAATKNYIDTFEALNTTATIAARDKAEQWAEEDEDVEVDTGKFSSKHYAIKAADSAAIALTAAVLVKTDGTTDPNVNNDSSEGYSVNSKWFNQITKEAFLCFDASIGNAVWEPTTIDATDLGGLALKNGVDNDEWNSGGADLEIANGGTGASSAPAARANLDVYSKSESASLVSSVESATAYIKVDQTGTQSIEKGYNIASITPSGVGITDVTFTNAMADANYIVVVGQTTKDRVTYVSNQTATGFRLESWTLELNAYSAATIHAAVFGDLA